MLHIVESHTHGKLTYHGTEQASALAYQLKDEPIDVVYTSNLQRTVDTAFIIADYHPLAAFIPVHHLRERDQGDYEGGRWEDVPYRQFEGEFLHRRMPGGESWRDVERRAAYFLNELYLTHSHETVLLVTHGGMLKTIRALLGGVTLAESIDQHVPNASVHYFAMNDPVHLVMH